ncbi:hypothetical protein [Marivivens aquimaris]|uniref:hypothetical protein n=1 Tax=Marivivens aquimaris TaxID=2774876 RepID=UPI00187E7CE6|nr:hypothetical protein [Marivivens aquimaris]
MRKKGLKVSMGKTGFHFWQVKIGRTPAPSIRVMNYDFRPNTGKRPFSQALLNVSAIGDAQKRPTISAEEAALVVEVEAEITQPPVQQQRRPSLSLVT